VLQELEELLPVAQNLLDPVGVGAGDLAAEGDDRGR
jgi:hypothetical protein